MSFQSIKFIPIFLVLGLVTTLGACTDTGEVSAPNDNITEEGIVEPDGTNENIDMDVE